MKSYKLVNSKEVQGKAFRLGYEVNKDFIDDPFIILYAEGKALKFSDIIDYANCDIQEITQADFLVLPEPFKVGDWVFISTPNVDRKQLVKVDLYSGNTMRDTDGMGYTPSDLEITKLTQDQTNILGLK